MSPFPSSPLQFPAFPSLFYPALSLSRTACTTVLLFAHLAHLIHCDYIALNQYDQHIEGDGTYIWTSTSNFIPQFEESYGTMLIGHLMSMSFSFIWNGRTTDDDYEMFFRIGEDADIGGTGCDGNNHRYPAFYITDEYPPHLLLYLSEEGHCSRHYLLTKYGTISEVE